MHRYRKFFVLSLLALLAFALLLVTTSTGIGLAPDSYFYIATARSLVNGHGVSLPNGPGAYIHSAHFPPLYAGLLALGSLGAFDPLAAAGWMNAILFGATIFLAGLTILLLTHGSLAAAALGALAVLASDELILIHSHVWSEPPFFFFSLAGLLLLSIYLVDGKLWRLAGAAAAFALAFLVRYAGITLVLTGAACMLLFVSPCKKTNERRLNRAEISDKTRHLLLFLALSCGPVGLWMIYNLLAAGSLTNRSLALHLVSLRDLTQGVRTVAGWLIPLERAGLFESLLALGIVLAGTVLLALPILRALRHPQKPEPEQASLLPYSIFTLGYGAFLLVSLSFFDDQTGLDARIMSPILVTGLILAAAGLGRWLPRLPRRARAPILLAVAVLGVVHLGSGLRMARGLYAGENKGYSEVAWRNSNLLKQIRDYPESTLIYSNGHDVIYLLTGRPAIGLPRMISPNSLRANDRFDEELQSMRSALEERGGLLVIFNALQERRRYLPAEYDLNEMLPLERITRWQKEGTLYRIKGGGE
jgi:hypothetical protein